MIIGSAPERPDIAAVRRIKHALTDALMLSDVAMVTVTQLACLEEDCAPLETVIGLLRSNMPQLQHKIHKSTDAIDDSDLVVVCDAWGFSIERSNIEKAFLES